VVYFRKVPASWKDDAIYIREKNDARRAPFGKKRRETLEHDGVFRLMIEVWHVWKILESFRLGNNMWVIQLGNSVDKHLNRCGAEG
jgi:hypothetical protein